MFNTEKRKLMKQSRRMIEVVLLVSTVIGLAALGRVRGNKMGALTPTASSSTTAGLESGVTIGLRQGNSGGQRMRAEIITIRPTGFDPTTITRSPGLFLLAVDNKTGLDAVTLRLTREGGNPVRETHLSPHQYKWREKITLPPGNYLLTEVDHASWLCRITITP